MEILETKTLTKHSGYTLFVQPRYSKLLTLGNKKKNKKPKIRGSSSRSHFRRHSKYRLWKQRSAPPTHLSIHSFSQSVYAGIIFHRFILKWLWGYSFCWFLQCFYRYKFRVTCEGLFSRGGSPRWNALLRGGPLECVGKHQSFGGNSILFFFGHLRVLWILTSEV